MKAIDGHARGEKCSDGLVLTTERQMWQDLWCSGVPREILEGSRV